MKRSGITAVWRKLFIYSKCVRRVLLAVLACAVIAGCEDDDDGGADVSVEQPVVTSTDTGGGDDSSSDEKPAPRPPPFPVDSNDDSGGGAAAPTTESWTMDFGGTSVALTITIATGAISGSVNVLGTDYPVSGTRSGVAWSMSINGTPVDPYDLTGAETDATHANGTSTHSMGAGTDWTATKN